MGSGKEEAEICRQEDGKGQGIAGISRQNTLTSLQKLGTVPEGDSRAGGLTPSSVTSSGVPSVNGGMMSRPLISTSLDKKMDFLLRSCKKNFPKWRFPTTFRGMWTRQNFAIS